MDTPLKRYRLISELLPLGTVFEHPAATKTVRHLPHYEVLISLGCDDTASVIIDAEAIERNPGYFEELPDKEEV